MKVFVFMFVVLCGFSFAAEYDVPKGNLIGVQDGLSQPSVLDVVEDKNGFIWLATQGGIDRFNGQSFFNISSGPDLKQRLPANYVNRLLYDDDSNQLYIGTINGLTALDLDTALLTPFDLIFPDGSTDANVGALYFDEANNFWVGTSKGLFKLAHDDTQFRFIKGSESISVFDITASNGTVFIATSRGLFIASDDFNTINKTNTDLTDSHRLLLDKDNHLWVDQSNAGLFKFDVRDARNPTLIATVNKKDGLIHDAVNDLLLNKDGSMWVATPKGVSIIDPEDARVIGQYVNKVQSANRFYNSHTFSLYQTTDGHVIVGSNNAGFTILDVATIMFDSMQFGDAISVEFITKKNQNEYYVTTEDGIFLFNTENKILSQSNFAPGDLERLGNNSVYSIEYLESTQSLWFASRNGLGELAQGKEYLRLTDFLNTRIYSVRESADGMLWVGGYEDGLFLYDPIKRAVISTWQMPLVTHVLDNGIDDIWVTTTGGLFRIGRTDRQLTRYSHSAEDPNSIPINALGWISKRDASSFFLGTLGRGVWIMELSANGFEMNFRALSTHPLLAGASIGAVVEGNDGNLWITTTSGIAKYDSEKDDLKIFGSSHGASSSGYYVGAVEQREDGRLYFPGLEGLTTFTPSKLAFNNYMPKAEIEQISIPQRNASEQDGKEPERLYRNLSVPEQLTLTPDDLLVTIKFAALELGDNRNIRFAYRVPEIDPSWLYLEQGQHSATLMNLPPGKYSLELKLHNRYLDWSEPQSHLTIHVTPNWYQTTWAKGAFGFAAMLFVFIVYKWRVLRYRVRSVILEKQVKQQTNALLEANKKLKELSIRDSLTGVLNRRGFSEWVENENAKYQRHSKPFSVLLLDVDFFKKINDKFGHESGDKALIHITNTLKQTIRAQDVIARWGGEEFIILLPETPAEDACAVAEKLRGSVERAPLMLDNITITCSITLGVACIKDFDHFDDCVSFADMMLYKGKQEGRNRVVCGSP